MDSLIETVSVTLSLVALFLVPFILFIIYSIKRNGLYINANCWFCNTWTKILYRDRNSFYCSTCLQYNGFNEDGDYNKVIEAQSETSTTTYNKTLRKTATVANGLCTYCNNNQQLKIHQLANFVPLNESNYDVEIEHFEKQLEKSYKLCKKCNSVLKTTIEKQHVWIFGNRLKTLKKKNLSSRNKYKISPETINRAKQTICLKFIKYMLILLCAFIICQILNIKINYPISKFRNYIPTTFLPYTILLNDIFNNVSVQVNDSFHKLNFYMPKHVILTYNDLLPFTCVGFLFQVILVIFEQRFIWWKINQLLGWILLITTFSIVFNESYLTHIKLLQAFCSTTLIYTLLSATKPEKLEAASMKQKFKFKKFNRPLENSNYSDVDEEVSEDSNSSELSKKFNSGKCFEYSKDLNVFKGDCRILPGTPTNFLFQSNVQNISKLHDSFTTARSTKSTSVLNKSFKSSSNLSSSSELNNSLDNLHLSNLKPPMCTSPVFSVSTTNRPILSPPKLKNVTQNSWTAGGFWKNDVTLFPVSSEFTNLSRSSSQTSGFVSNNDPVNVNPFSSLPSSRDPSVCGDFERTSILSEPPYHFQPISSSDLNSSCILKNNAYHNVPQSPKLSLSPNSNQLYYKADNMFYPVLNQHNMLFIQGGNHSRKFESSFSNLSLKGFNMNTNGIKTPPLFGKQPVVSSLFKNLPGINTQSYSFRAPHC